MKSRLSNASSGEVLLKIKLIKPRYFLLIVLLEMLHVPRTWQWLAVKVLQVIASSSGVTDNLVGILPSRS